MKVVEHVAPVAAPPPTYSIEGLTADEAEQLTAALGGMKDTLYDLFHQLANAVPDYDGRYVLVHEGTYTPRVMKETP